MELYSEGKDYKLYHGNMLDMLEVIKPNSIDSIITDPPYELGFMGKSWDNSGIAYQKESWEKCYEVLKPGGYLLAFGGSRTFHRIACAIEDAGFEIRDTIMWLYGSGFPKSMNIGLYADKKEGLQGQRGIGGFNVGGIQEQQNRKSKLYIGSTTDGSKQTAYTNYKSDLAKKWQGWGTCLKPAYEPIIVARKPVENSVVENVMKYGVGGINIDECRIGNELIKGGTMPKMNGGEQGVCNYNTIGADRIDREDTLGRFPANIIHDGSDEVIADMPNTKGSGGEPNTEKSKCECRVYVSGENKLWHKSGTHFEDEGSASRYFYCAKASMKDRDEGLDNFDDGNISDGRNAECDRPYLRKETSRKNIHPTVKPMELMQYIVRLVSPKGATILDCFNGSGSTGKAVMFENKERNANYKYIGIELTDEYLPISKARIEYVINNDFDFWKDENGRTQHEVVKKNKNQMSIFDFEVE